MNNNGQTGNNVGSIEADAIQNHSHYVVGTLPSQGINVQYNAASTVNAACFGSGVTSDNEPNTGNVFPNGTHYASETRPKNAYVNYIIKY